MAQLGVDREQLVNTLVQCSLRQMLENGFFHADPHAGNLLITADGRLTYIDFGMMSYVEPTQRYGIIEAVVHMVNRDFGALAQLYKRMGFIPPQQDTRAIVDALNDALPDVLNASVGELNFKNVIGKLGDVMYKYPFSLPPYYIAIIRCLGVLEGLAMQVDREFAIINDAYPYIASRLLTDPAPELQSALTQLIFKDGRLRWEYLESLLDTATGTGDYDVLMALQQLLRYTLSDEGDHVREMLVSEAVDYIDTLGFDTAVYTHRQLLQLGRDTPGLQAVAPLVERLTPPAVGTGEAEVTPGMATALKVLQIMRKSEGFEPEKLSPLLARVLRDPKAQATLSDFSLRLSERVITRAIRVVFDLPTEPTPPAGRSG